MRPLPIGSSDCICCNDKGINVLSLFDGMSCGQLALDRLGIKVDVYLAAEIDKYAKQITKKNYPNTVHLGDVTKLRGMDLPKIDLLMGGSPCQGFSFAGKQLNFDDPRSALFFEFVRLLEETKPKYFLLENVRMKQEYQDIISEHLGVKPIMINSALVSAQNRVRLYWTNIPNIEQPEDKGIVLKDILEDFYENPVIDQLPRGANKGGITASSLKKGKTPSLTPSSWQHNNHLCELKEFNPDSLCHHVATATDIKGNESIKRVYADSGKSPTITTMGGGHREPKVLVIKEATKKGYTEIQDGDVNVKGAAKRNQVTKRGIEAQLNIRKDDKSNCVVSSWSHKLNGCVEYINDKPTYRKLTPIECERLQTVPDGYTEGVSNTQRYKMLGNGWTVDVISHILKNI